MSALSADRLFPNQPASAAKPKPQSRERKGFWPHLVQALETFFIARTRHAVPEIELRRSRYEIKRCRRLMLAAAPTTVTTAHAASRRTAHASGARS